MHASGTLVYTNNSPDTLRELFFHQYLNAFRPGSAWSAVDTREGRVRFQNLSDPHYGYERFTAPPTINGTPVAPEYPGAPDSTVAHFALPHPLAPGDSCVITLRWDARPSTVLRRQGRRGRSYDFAQWFPKVAVYDRHGWEAPAFTPAGELYGEFGTYDVTLVLRDDQIVAATGVVVAGDPGWTHRPTSGTGDEPGWRTVRFRANNVHHFAWTTSPDYRYEGGDYVTPAGTVAVHVLYRPGDEATWGRGIAVRRTEQALAWLESVYGPYAYPQLTNVHRLEGGGTEFPMMIMDGSASQGLILHEAGHQYTYAMLANNEYASAWMDEGLSDYQTGWAERLTRADRHQAPGELQIPISQEGIGPPRARGYRALAVTPLPAEREDIRLDSLDLVHRDQPVGWSANQFSEFGIYNAMVYGRAVRMYGALRDILGETAWRLLLRGYYARWKFKHVDEMAFRTEAERAAGRDLSWFFDQWLRKVGLVEYALGGWTAAPDGDGWTSNVTVVRRGPYLHPMPVGIRTADGWTFGRSEPLRDPDTVHVRTRLKPLEVRLDPTIPTLEAASNEAFNAAHHLQGQTLVAYALRAAEKISRTMEDQESAMPYAEPVDLATLSPPTIAADLRATLARAERQLSAMSLRRAARPLAPGKRCTGRPNSFSHRLTVRSSRPKKTAISFQESRRWRFVDAVLPTICREVSGSVG